MHFTCPAHSVLRTHFIICTVHMPTQTRSGLEHIANKAWDSKIFFAFNVNEKHALLNAMKNKV